jgi:thiol:disulfide interchange protein DsbC
VLAQEAAIRKNLAERLPDLPKIDEVTKTPIPGVYEIRIGTDILYSDEQGEHLIQGRLIETKTRNDLTEARVNKLTAIDFSKLPLKDALVWKQGSGARKLVVFADPNCGYCKKFERDLQQVKDVTVYTFLYPILGSDSSEKSRNIWCAKDSIKVWRDWMIENNRCRRWRGSATPPPCSATSPSAASTASPAPRRWCLRTARPSRALSAPHRSSSCSPRLDRRTDRLCAGSNGTAAWSP